MLATSLRWALDAALWAREALAFEPDPWQTEMLRSDAGRMLLLCCRQSGKSTTAALVGLHLALYRPGSLVLLLSPSLRQSGELFRKVAGFYGQLRPPVPSEAESALRLELQNGSRIVSLPGTESTVRGYSGVDLLVIDEASRVEDALYYAVRPMLAVSKGRLIALSTPWGKRGFFFTEWNESAADWQRVKIAAPQCPRITPEFLRDERRALGAMCYRQEYECSFEDMQGALFTYEDAMGTLTSEGEALFWDDIDGPKETRR